MYLQFSLCLTSGYDFHFISSTSSLRIDERVLCRFEITSLNATTVDHIPWSWQINKLENGKWKIN